VNCDRGQHHIESSAESNSPGLQYINNISKQRLKCYFSLNEKHAQTHLWKRLQRCGNWKVLAYLNCYMHRLKSTCRGCLGVPTAGWRNAHAYSPRGSTRESAKLFGWSSSGAKTQEHTDLEWFGPPERNTLHSLCGVLSMNESILCPARLLFGLSPSLTGVSLL